ncbi:MAG: S-layer homology domain-containing protein [Clostridia bacterium]|nr:S-layer homology domain-containing protein [Clostridia bacterium]
MKTPARRFFSIFLAIIMALSTQIFCFCADVLAEAPIIYVSPDGNDTSGDGTSDAPFATLKKAFSKINGSLGATIVLMGDIESSNAKAWNSAYSAIKGHTGLLTITGKDPVSGTVYENVKLRYDSTISEGPIKLEYLALTPSRDYSFIETAGYDFTMGKGITEENFPIYIHDGVCPGAGRTVVSGTNTVIESGKVSTIFVGGGYPTSTSYGVEGDCHLTIDGGTVSSLIIGFDRYKDTHTEAFIDGNVIVTINDGAVVSISQKQLLGDKIGGHFTIVSNNETSLPDVSKIIAEEGKYIVRTGRNGMVIPTERAGVFNYEVSAKYPCYVDGELAEGGIFTVEPGEHNVSFRRQNRESFKGAYAAGFPDGTFGPDQGLTRAQAIQLVLNASGEAENARGTESSFADISKSDWYYAAAAYLEENNILPEEWQGELLPNEPITRGEFIYIVDGMLVKNTASAKLVSFSDVTPDSTPYFDAISEAIKSDCINGYEDGTFRPENFLTRAEAITVLNRYLSRSAVDGAESGFSDVDGHWADDHVIAATSDISENKWVYNPDGNSGASFVMPSGEGLDAADYIVSLHSQSASLSAKAIRNGVETIAEQMKEDILNTRNTLEIYGARITGTKYYISENGSDSIGTGTVSSPFKSMAGLKAKITLRSGDAVLFERGGVYRGSFSVSSGVTYGAYGTGNKPIIMQSKKNYADPALWKKTEWGNVWVCTELLNNVGIIGFDHDIQDYSKDTYNELYGITMNKNMYGFMGPSQLCGDLQFYSELNGNVSGAGELYLYSKDGNPGERFSSIEIGEKQDIVTGSANNVVIDNLSFKFTGSHGMGGAGGCKNRTVTNCIYSWLGGSILSLDFHGNGSPVNYGNAVEIYGACDGYYVENNWMYQIYDTAVTHQRSSSTGDCIQENIHYSKNLMEYVFWAIESYNAPPKLSPGQEDTWTRITRNYLADYNVMRLGGYGWGSIVRHRTSQLYWCNAISENYDCYSQYNILDRAYGYLVGYPSNHNEVPDKNIYIQHIGQPLRLKGQNIVCGYDFAEQIAESWGDKNAVVIVIDASLEPIVRNFPEGFIEPDALY